MVKKHVSIHEIAFESIQGILIATVWYLVLFGVAYFLEYILPEFTWKSLVVISAYLVKYILLALDLFLFFYMLKTEVEITMQRIKRYKREHL